ncbi:MAG: AAA family ATPase [Defluviitaleaceae bacterium]|nr:AAA family ATPase [Defluviitaleaceae bacterium]
MEGFDAVRKAILNTKLPYTKLKQFLNDIPLNFTTTDELEVNSEIIGQDRAARAIEFGLNVKSKGYNIYAVGMSGTGKTTFAKRFAEKIAKTEPVPMDLCYVYNFKDPKYPKYLRLPAGRGHELKEDMDDLINRLQIELTKAFSSKEFENKKADIVRIYQDHRDEITRIMTEEAKEHDFSAKTTNSGIYFMPIVDGEVISEEQFDTLSQEEKDKIVVKSEEIQKRAQEAMRDIREFEKLTRRDVEAFEYSVGLFTVGHHIGSLLSKYDGDDEVLAYFIDVREGILDNISDFVDSENQTAEEAVQSLFPWSGKSSSDEVFSKYKVNVIVDNTDQKHAPVIVDFNPTYTNLVGEIEYDNEFGNLTTDFMKIKGGLCHKANGGYLIIQAHDLLTNYHAWDVLRRVLVTEEVVIEPLREFSTGVVVSGIKPQPIPVAFKVILVGTDYIYDLLYEFDDEFRKLFKICAEFDYEMDYSSDNIQSMACFIKLLADKEKLLPFTSDACAEVTECSMRIAERQGKLTTRFSRISEILTEANTWAKLEKADAVTGEHIKKAVSERDYRLNMYEEKLSELIEDNVVMIDIESERIGQINGLAVLGVGDYAFAKPSKITATTHVGKAGIINVEKEAEMSGSIHNKGVQVLCGYLGQKYAQDFPLSVSCRLCFEQNYSGIDGDSASSTELYAVLSSLANAPIRQDIAVTGSMSQWGEIQPIGGVTHKIEGFFDLCNQRGLTGKQGVIIPVNNVKDLVLKESVIEAVKSEKFHIYAISHVDEGIEILTGIKAGEKNAKGKYPPASIHGRVMKKLKEFNKKSEGE